MALTDLNGDTKPDLVTASEYSDTVPENSSIAAGTWWAAGLGYWALVIGVVAGAWAAAIVAMRASPFKATPGHSPRPGAERVRRRSGGRRRGSRPP